MRRYLIIFLFFPIYSSFLSDEDFNKLAVVQVPVADAAIGPLQFLNFPKLVEDIYKEQPCSPEIGKYACSRSHQLLFNEVVKVKQEFGNEIECEVYNAFYQRDREQVWTFWTLKKNVILLKLLIQNNCDLTSIPLPYFDKKKNLINDENILTICCPFKDEGTQLIYSAGTRFVRISTSDKKETYAVKIFDFNNNYRIINIPKDLVVLSQPRNDKEKINMFVEILKKWANLNPEKIPFIWGGSSWIEKVNVLDYKLVSEYKFGNQIEYWIRPTKEYPYTGFDAAQIVLRAAQIVGMPYFFKSTRTVENYVRQMQSYDAIENGDIIWYPGGQAIVSDLENNELIGAFGYKSWNGVIQSCKLEKVFQNIKTYQDLRNAIEKKVLFKILDFNGNFIREEPGIKILKIKSIFG